MAKKKSMRKPDTVVTLTLPSQGGIQRTGTLLIQRGDLAFQAQFHYTNVGDIASAIKDATNRLVALEVEPPPDIKTTPDDEYKPDLEQRRQQLQIGAQVRCEDGEGEIVALEGDQYRVDLGHGMHGVYRVDDLKPIPQPEDPPEETSPIDPVTVGTPIADSDRLATDIRTSATEVEQLALL